MEAGIITICAFISPYNGDRQRVREIIPNGDFIETFVDCPLEVCEQRDPKGLYKKARSGLIKNFTGIDDPFEKPSTPEISIRTDKFCLDDSVNKILKYLEQGNYLREKIECLEVSLT